MSHVFIDLETHSDLDVTEVGAYVYAEHPSTKVLCACVARDDGPIETLLDIDELWEYLADLPPATLVACNCDFERQVLLHQDIDLTGWEWDDIAARSARMSLPRSLEEQAAFWFPDKPDLAKDMVGNAVMLKLARARKATKKEPNPPKWWTPEDAPEDFEKLYEYCAQDVRVTRAIYKRQLALDAQEKRVWLLTQKMNERGVKVDLPSIKLAEAHLARHTGALAAQFQAITGLKPSQRQKLTKYFNLKNMKAGTVRHFARTLEKGTDTHRAVELYRTLARSSTAKLTAFMRRLSKDGRLHGAFVYCGAERTGRWSSMGVQLHNFPRGLGTLTDAAFDALAAGCLEELFEGLTRPAPARPLDVVGAIAEMLRGFLLGPWTVSDLAQIEARVLNWLAGQDDVTRIFASGGDVYCKLASVIYGREVTKKDKDFRFTGKTAELGCGYSIGFKKLQTQFDEQFDVAIDQAFAKKIVNAYRKSHPKVVRLWSALEAGMVFAIKNRSKRIRVPAAVPIRMGIIEQGGEDFLFIELPSGRRMYYARPTIKDGQIRYYGRHPKLGWTMVKTYGGKITENVVQAISRDALVEAMLRLDDAGFPVNLSVHDEVGSEGGDPKEMEKLMTEVPPWASGLPVAAETFESARYRK
jgi:DNA polymerase